jgi:hypothetical protein
VGCLRGKFNPAGGNAVPGEEDILEGSRDYPSGITLSNVTALLQHLMQSPVSNHFHGFSKIC